MDAKLPIDTFENVMGLAIEGCKAIATYIREVNKFLLIFRYLFCFLFAWTQDLPLTRWNFWVVDYRSGTGAIGEYKEA